jgi:hypothetical protein
VAAQWLAATGSSIDMTQCDMAWGGGQECDAFSLWVGDDSVLGGEFYKDEEQCQLHECPVDCEAYNWGQWGACTATCQHGTTTRTRQVKIPENYGGAACVNDGFPELHSQTEECNENVSCDKYDLPQCQTDHVHCEIKTHQLHEDRTWMTSIDTSGMRYYHNTETGESTYTKPADFVECAAPLPLTWQTTAVHNRTDLPVPGADPGQHTFTQIAEGGFHPHITQDCINNQDCGMVDLGACHGCDSEQECKDMGLSSTVFVTHHREHMGQQKYDPATGTYQQAQYNCKRGDNGDCHCTCDAHPPCVVRQGYVLRECQGRHAAHNIAEPHSIAIEDDDEHEACNEMLHGNAFPGIPNMQDCCNLCTNHPDCGAWEYSSTQLCVLKAGAPAFKAVPSDSTFAVWSGCRAGETC